MPTGHPPSHAWATVVALVAATMLAPLAGCKPQTPAPNAPVPVPVTAAPAADDGWATLQTDPYPGKRDDIVFATAERGWYGTGKGELFATRDGGTTWSPVWSQPGTFIRALGFVDATRGFLGNVGTEYYPGVTDEVPLYETRDAGVNWTPVDLGGGVVKGICAIDVVHTEHIFQGALRPVAIVHAAGRVGGPTALVRSVDSGGSWSVIDMTPHAGMILDVKFFDANHGLVFASTSAQTEQAQALILETSDGGHTWSTVYTAERTPENVWKASFPTPAVGFATVQNYDPERAQQVILKTMDGGAHWAEFPMVLDAEARQFGIGFVDAQTGWVGTKVGGFVTRDGGRSWAKANLAPGANKIRTRAADGSPILVSIGTAVQQHTR